MTKAKRTPRRKYGRHGQLILSALTPTQRRLLDEARRIDDEYPMRVDMLRSERAQAFRDCVAAGISPRQIAAHLVKDPVVVYRWLDGPLPAEKWLTDTNPEGATTT